MFLFSVTSNCSLQSASQKSGQKDQHDGGRQLGRSLTVTPTWGPWVRLQPNETHISGGGSEDSFLNALHVSEAVVTIVAMGWARISSQFSAEL